MELNPEVIKLQYEHLTEQNARILEKLETFLPRETFAVWEKGLVETLAEIRKQHSDHVIESTKNVGDLRAELKGDIKAIVDEQKDNTKSFRNLWLTVILGFLSTVAAGVTIAKLTGAI